MSLEDMKHDYSKRSYLLPAGCKDLIDVLKLEEKAKQAQPVFPSQKPSFFPPITGEIQIRDQISARELAALTNRKPFQIIADLMELGVFANVNQPLDFVTASRVVRKYGYAAKHMP